MASTADTPTSQTQVSSDLLIQLPIEEEVEGVELSIEEEAEGVELSVGGEIEI